MQAVSRTPAKVTQADIARAIRAIEQTGANLAVEIARDGTIRLIPVESLPRHDEIDKTEEIVL